MIVASPSFVDPPKAGVLSLLSVVSSVIVGAIVSIVIVAVSCVIFPAGSVAIRVIVFSPSFKGVSTVSDHVPSSLLVAV